MPIHYGCDIPEDLYYHPDYDSWVRFADDETATLGMTDIAQTRAGKLIHVKFKKVGKVVLAGKIAATIESGKWVGPFIMPMDAEILAINDQTFEKDILIANKDPYGEGWLMKVRFSQSEVVRQTLLTGQDAFKYFVIKIEENDIHCFRCAD